MSLILLVILILLLLLAITIILLHRWNLKKMNEQLKQIIQQFGTNELLRTNLPSRDLTVFIGNINQLINLFKQNEQLNIRQNRAFKQEITNISHDIRTPLTSIKGFSELLQDPELTEAERNDYLVIIKKKVATLMQTVDLFYEISQIDSEALDLQFQSFPLEEVLVETLLLFQKDFDERNVLVKIEEQHLHATIWADKRATQRILLNIVQNALRYAYSFFQIEIFVKEEFLVVQAKNDADTITEEDIAHVFERSFTVDRSRHQGQTGLGLYIAQKLAEEQGGRIEAFLKQGDFAINLYLPTTPPN